MDNNRLNEINNEIDITIDMSLASSRRMVGLTHLTREVGTHIIEDMSEASEKLHKINVHSNKINDNLNHTQKTLNRMLCCLCPCIKKPKIIKNTMDDINEEKIDINYSVRNRDKYTGRFIRTILNDIREEEINENIKEADSVINDIKNQALIIGNEIDIQNKLIDNITNNINNNNINIKTVNTSVKNIFNKN